MDEDLEMKPAGEAPRQKFGGIPASDHSTPAPGTDDHKERPPKRARTAGDLSKLAGSSDSAQAGEEERKTDELEPQTAAARMQALVAETEAKAQVKVGGLGGTSSNSLPPLPSSGGSLFPPLFPGAGAKPPVVPEQPKPAPAAPAAAKPANEGRKSVPTKRYDAEEAEFEDEGDSDEEEFDSADDDYVEDERPKNSGALLKRAKQIATKLRKSTSCTSSSRDRTLSPSTSL